MRVTINYFRQLEISKPMVNFKYFIGLADNLCSHFLKRKKKSAFGYSLHDNVYI